jgi:dihydroorotase
VDLIRSAKKKGIPVSAETCPHYFSLTEEAVQRYDTHAKMKPPLRTRDDLESVCEGLADGTIDIIASDHAPHDPESKEKEFSRAPFGIIGLETLFPLTYNELILKKILSPLEAAGKLTENPAKTFHLQGGRVSPGAPADIVIFDPNKSWTANKFASKSSNSPFTGRRFEGRIVLTMVGGKIVFRSESFAGRPVAASSA